MHIAGDVMARAEYKKSVSQYKKWLSGGVINQEVYDELIRLLDLVAFWASCSTEE